VPVDLHDGAVDERVFEIRLAGQFPEHRVKYPAQGPPAEALPNREPLPEALRQIAPGRTRAHDPQHPLERRTIVAAGAPGVAFLARKERRDALPLRVRQNGPNQGGPPFFSLESLLLPFWNRLYYECLQSLALLFAASS
jgi:hypothetical protein